MDTRKILYTPCNKCSKCPYDCNHFEYIVDTINKIEAVPIPKEHNKECYDKLEILNV